MNWSHQRRSQTGLYFRNKKKPGSTKLWQGLRFFVIFKIMAMNASCLQNGRFFFREMQQKLEGVTISKIPWSVLAIRYWSVLATRYWLAFFFFREIQQKLEGVRISNIPCSVLATRYWSVLATTYWSVLATTYWSVLATTYWLMNNCAKCGRFQLSVLGLNSWEGTKNSSLRNSRYSVQLCRKPMKLSNFEEFFSLRGRP